MTDFAWWLIESALMGALAMSIIVTAAILIIGGVAMGRELWADRHTVYEWPAPSSHVQVVRCKPDDDVNQIVARAAREAWEIAERAQREADEIAALERQWSQSNHPARGEDVA